MTTETEYYAVPDPTDPAQMTYWRRDKRGRITAWPAKARYGPLLYGSDVPANLGGQQRNDWIRRWYEQHSHPWHGRIHAAIATDPDGCAASFAAFMSRCCCCGRELTDPASKAYGVGPECRDGWPPERLAASAIRVGQAHAQATSAGPPPGGTSA